MVILILIDVQYSQNAVFSFEKGSNCQNHSSSGSHHPVKKFPYSKIADFCGGISPNLPPPPHPPDLAKPCNRLCFRFLLNHLLHWLLMYDTFVDGKLHEVTSFRVKICETQCLHFDRN